MARVLVGEMQVQCGAARMVLRPSFGALYAIEQQMLCSISHLRKCCAEGWVTAEQLRIITQEGARAAVLAGHSSTFGDGADAVISAQDAARFLSGGVDGAEMEGHWEEYYKTATGILGRSESEFWQMTPISFEMTCEAFAAMHGVDLHRSEALSAEELRGLMRQIPDTI